MTAVDIRIYEVGPRDGLQAEPTIVATEDKLRFIAMLADAGLREIETTSLVSPKAIPQLADAEKLLKALDRRAEVRYPVLVPNQRGLERAVAAGVNAICLITAATDSYVRHNIGMSQEASLAAFEPIAAEARQRGWWIRGYVSAAFGCPYEGEVDASAVVAVSERLRAMGVDELAISDTVGVAAPTDVKRVLRALAAAGIGSDMIGLHFHDTRGTALANVIAAVEAGVTTFDASTGGTGGSPFAPGAAGNLATEDLVYLLDRQGLRHGVDLDGVLEAARFIWASLGRQRTGQQAGSCRRVATVGLEPMEPMPARPEAGERLPLILDVDTGIDDMVALLIAATAPELNLRGVTCVAGNVEIHHVARNTGKILQMVGRADVPVSIGAARPLQRRLRTAPETHGPTGTGYVELRGEDRKLGSTEYTPIPAARYLGAHIRRHPGEMTVVALGPLTNLAAAANNGVDLARGARQVVWMGGTLEERGQHDRDR